MESKQKYWQGTLEFAGSLNGIEIGRAASQLLISCTHSDGFFRATTRGLIFFLVLADF